MSWGVSACGFASKIAAQLEEQFSKINCTDPGEQETVQNVRACVAQTLATIEPDKAVSVMASGSMGYQKWGLGVNHPTSPHVGPYQSVDLKISPIHFTT